MVKVLVKKLNSAVKLPEYKTIGASGMDLIAFTNKPIIVKSKTSSLIPTGLLLLFQITLNFKLGQDQVWLQKII